MIVSTAAAWVVKSPAQERLAYLDAGRTAAIPADQVARTLRL